MRKYNARRGEKPTKFIRKAVLETLEGRTCLSATVGLEGGVLTLHADPNTPSALIVQPAANGQVWAFVSNVQHKYSLKQIKSVVMIGSNQNDWIYIDPRLNLPASITGGAGNDTIKGGGGYDTIDAGDGNDLVYADGIINTGNGNDTVWGGNKGDSITAGDGNDLLVGGWGNDTITGGSGRTTIIGGLGNDRLIAGSGNTVITASWGSSTLNGGSGNDTLNGGGGGNHLIPANTGTVVHAGWHDVIDQPTGDAHDPTDVPTAPSKTPPTVGVPPVTTPPITPPPVTPTPPASNPGSGTGTKATDGTQAVITQLGTTVMVGEGVNVNGTSSTLGAGTDLTDIYQWNFGDPNSRFNTMTGWNAGHVYDNPGVYTITLTITDVNCQVSTATSKVTVTADNRPIIYVDTNGSDSNNGLSPSTPVKTAAKAFELAGSDSVIEFHRGEKFAVNQTLMINGNDMAVSTYGSGANPVLVRGVGDGSVTIFLTNKASNITVQNLTFDSIYPAVNGIGAEIPVVGVWAQGTNVVVRNCTFLNVEDAVEGNWGLNGVVVQDNSAPLMTGLRGYFCWVDGSNWTIDGNTVVNTTRQHVVRGNDQAIDSVEIAGNNFAKPLNPQDPGETMKCTVNFRGGSHIYVTGNVLNGVVSFGPDDYSDLSQNVSDVVIENNRITQQLDLIDGVHHFMVRNNVLQLDGTDQIYVKSVDTGVSGRYVTDITLTHNTGIDNATGGQFLYVAGNAQPGIITLTDNLFIAPHLQLGINMGASVLVDTPNLNAFSLISGNVWPAATGSNRDVPGAVNYAYGSWYADQGWLTATEWNSQSQVENDVFQTVLAPTDGNGIQTQFGPAGAIGYVPG